MEEKKKKNIFSKIFKFSFLYYAFWIGVSIVLIFTGIDDGWAMPAMSDGTLTYGFEAFESGIIIGLLYTIEFCWFIPLYQVVYLLCISFKALVKSTNEK